MNVIPLKKYTGLCKPWRLSQDLMVLLGVQVASYAQLNRLLWAYIKKHKLQDNRDKRYIFPDSRLFRVVGMGRMKASLLCKYVKPHLRPMDQGPDQWDSKHQIVCEHIVLKSFQIPNKYWPISQSLYSTVCHRNIAPSFQMEKVWFF